jgi:hypothetical protein
MRNTDIGGKRKRFGGAFADHSGRNNICNMAAISNVPYSSEGGPIELDGPGRRDDQERVGSWYHMQMRRLT